MPSKAFEAGDNFDALRFLFATCVAVFHFVALTGGPSLGFTAGWLSLGAELSVGGFFVLSGYLVLGSFQRSKNLREYAEKRFRRLYPAYAAIILICAAGALLVSSPARNDLAAVAKYLGANLLFLNFLAPTLPGVFEDNRLQAVNGALWTLKIEVAFYCLLPLIAIAAEKLRDAKWLLFGTLYVVAEIWRATFHSAGGAFAVLAHQLPGQVSYFITGMALWEARKHFKPGRLTAGLGLAVLTASFFLTPLESSRAGALGILVIALANAPRSRFKFERRGDSSYGIYIVHFPIIQAIHAISGQIPIWVQACLSGMLIFGVACLFWRFLERPLLYSGSHYKTRGVGAA